MNNKDEEGYMYFSSVVNYRIKIKEDGSFSHPEILSKFTTETYAKKKKPAKKEKKPVEIVKAEQEEEYY